MTLGGTVEWDTVMEVGTLDTEDAIDLEESSKWFCVKDWPCVQTSTVIDVYLSQCLIFYVNMWLRVTFSEKSMMVGPVDHNMMTYVSRMVSVNITFGSFFSSEQVTLRKNIHFHLRTMDSSSITPTSSTFLPSYPSRSCGKCNSLYICPIHFKFCASSASPRPPRKCHVTVLTH